MKVKQVNVTTVAQDVKFYVGKTDFLIQNYSDVDVTVNIDSKAVVGNNECAIVIAKLQDNLVKEEMYYL